ncbi:kinase-like domain-containing protein [Paraphoma chrysanthemicola]|nr:kinase-like domain-containing protein [Paraphoma chrysanthemicola]
MASDNLIIASPDAREIDVPTVANSDQQDNDDHFPINEKVHFRYTVIDQIDHGSTGNVEQVRDEQRGLTFARQRIEIESESSRKDKQNVFAKEIKTIKSLVGHSHFVRFVEGYATIRHFYLVLQPRADKGDLARYLDAYLSSRRKPLDSGTESMTYVLERALGCLASGLAFMHEKEICHRDVKPKNILINEGAVVWADFGYSRDYSLFEHDVTKGPVDAQTKRYSAPEVLLRDERDSKADIYSLGCVFLEIFYAIVWGRTALSPGKLFSEQMPHLLLAVDANEVPEIYISPQPHKPNRFAQSV